MTATGFLCWPFDKLKDLPYGFRLNRGFLGRLQSSQREICYNQLIFNYNVELLKEGIKRIAN